MYFEQDFIVFVSRLDICISYWLSFWRPSPVFHPICWSIKYIVFRKSEEKIGLTGSRGSLSQREKLVMWALKKIKLERWTSNLFRLFYYEKFQVKIHIKTVIFVSKSYKKTSVLFTHFFKMTFFIFSSIRLVLVYFCCLKLCMLKGSTRFGDGSNSTEYSQANDSTELSDSSNTNDYNNKFSQYFHPTNITHINTTEFITPVNSTQINLVINSSLVNWRCPIISIPSIFTSSSPSFTSFPSPSPSTPLSCQCEVSHTLRCDGQVSKNRKQTKQILYSILNSIRNITLFTLFKIKVELKNNNLKFNKLITTCRLWSSCDWKIRTW